MPDLWLARLATAAAALSAAVACGTIALIVAGWGDGVGAYASSQSDIVVGLLFPAAGALIIRRQPRNAAGWVLLSAGLVAVSAFTHQWVHHIQEAGPGSLPGRDVAVWLASWAFVPYWLQPTLLPLLFPDGTAPSPRWRRLGQAVVGVTVAGGSRPRSDPTPTWRTWGSPTPSAWVQRGSCPRSECSCSGRRSSASSSPHRCASRR